MLVRVGEEPAIDLAADIGTHRLRNVRQGRRGHSICDALQPALTFGGFCGGLWQELKRSAVDGGANSYYESMAFTEADYGK